MGKSDIIRTILSIFILAAVIFLISTQYSDIQERKMNNAVSVEEEYNDNEVIDADKWSIFSSRSIEDIVNQYNKMVESVDNDYIYESEPQAGEGYNIGTLSDSALDSVLSVVNYYRWLEGVSEVSISKTDCMGMQAAAYINVLSQQISGVMENRPEGMPVELYKLCIGSIPDGLVKLTTFNTGIKDSMNGGLDFNDDKILGSRLALMSYKTRKIAFGYYSNIFTCCGYGDGQEEGMIYSFVSYPSPGFYPANEIDKELSAWHIELNREMVTYEKTEDIRIVITDMTDGKVYDREKDNGLFVKDNVIIFYPPEEDGILYTHKYRVQIYGLRAASGKEIEIKYTVNFFDRTKYDYSKITEVDYDSQIVFAPADMPQSRIKALLPEYITVKLENGNEFSVKIADWAVNVSEKSGLQDNLYVAVIDKESLSEYAVDSSGLLNNCNVNIRTYEEEMRIVKHNTGDGSVEFYVEDINGEVFSEVEWYYMDKDNVNYIESSERIKVNEDDSNRDYVAKVKQGEVTWLVK